ncbi:MAG: hypothetical protein J0M18_00465 [Ignavibacteria bacterium]|jgi:AraC-like DNA-binding protein|nr:hypothetical protein [Ignavibacteria bacterium]
MLRPSDVFLNFYLTSNSPLVTNLADTIGTEISIHGYNQDDKKAFLITLLLNLKLTYDSGAFIPLHRSPKYYAKLTKKYCSSKQSYKIVTQITDGLITAGYLRIGGFISRARASTYQATDKLMKLLRPIPNSVIQLERPKTFVVLRKKISDDDTEYITEVDYTDALADAINEDLKKYNTLREKTQLSLKNVPAQIAQNLRQKLEQISLENFKNIKANADGSYNFNLIPTHLYRIFNEDFNHGGRFYRGVESNMASTYINIGGVEQKVKLREFIEINGNSTIELDYSAMHPRMLYHMKGIDYRNDPNMIEKSCSNEMRTIYKIVGLICINSESEAKAVDAIQDDLQKAGLTPYLPDNTDATRKKLINKFRKKNRRIDEYFLTGEGLRLQNKDSDIAHSILMHFAERGILVLCVHDSFIIEKKYEKELKRKMKEFYHAKMGFQPVIK